MVNRKQRRASASTAGKKADPAPAPAGQPPEGQPATHLAIPMPMLEAVIEYLKSGRFDFDKAAFLLAAMVDKKVCLPLVLAPIEAQPAQAPGDQPSA